MAVVGAIMLVGLFTIGLVYRAFKQKIGNPMAMKTSREGLIEIASHEGIVTSPYRDSVGVWTVGIGHTASAGPPDPATERRAFSIAEIMAIFARDIARFEARVNRAFTVKLKQHEFDAAVSFDFNTGGIHRASWVKDINAGNRTAARQAFMRWRKPPEIIPRRQKECDLFFKGRYASGGKAHVYPASAGGHVLWRKGQSADVGRLMDDTIAPRTKPRVQSRPGAREPQSKPPATRCGGLLASLIGFFRKWRTS